MTCARSTDTSPPTIPRQPEGSWRTYERPCIGSRTIPGSVISATTSLTKPCGYGPSTPNLVIYRADARPLQVVRVLSGYRDIGALFS